MCGIAGAFAFDPRSGPANASTIEQLNDLQRRRGPDGSGLWSSDDNRIVFGHRRLAVIDTGSSGAQPMSDTTGRWTITFNGEIYNYREVRSELERIGCVFSTNSDTEVLINSVAHWGEAGLRKLRGMYAFALWDNLQKELWLVRDPYGIKPLYVSEHAGTIWFASHARSLAQCAPVDVSQEAAAVTGFYLWGHVPEPFTWWAGIRMLPAGHLQRVRAGQVPSLPRSYHRIQDDYASRPGQPLEPGQLRQLMLDSVRHHLVSDVPVGVFLSAGIDSSVIAALAAELGTQLRTITLAFDEYVGTPNDEAPLAEETARVLRSDHTTVRINRDEFEKVLDDFLSVMDQPTIDGLNTFLVSRAAAKQGLKVALSGLGGDELFGGYPSFRQIPKLLKWASWIPARKTLGRGFQQIFRSIPLPFLPPKAAGLITYSGDIASAYFLRRALNLEGQLDALLDKQTLTEGLEKLSTIKAVAATVDTLDASGVTKYAQISALESCWYMRNQLLRDTDWSSMAHGLEVRVPFVDVNLLEHIAPAVASNAPPTKMDLARCAAQLPASALSRPKTGFTTPVRDWIVQIQTPERQSRGLEGWAINVHRQFCNNKNAPDSDHGAMRQSNSAISERDRHSDAQEKRSTLSIHSEKISAKKNVVIFRQGSIGDFVIALPCLHAIRKIYPSARVTLLTNLATNSATAPAKSILEGTYLIDDYFNYRGGTRSIRELIKIRTALSQIAPELLIYLAEPKGMLATYRDFLFFRWCGIKEIIGLPMTRDLQYPRPLNPEGALWESEASRLARTLKSPQTVAVEKSENWDLHLSAAEIEAAKRLLREGDYFEKDGKIPLLGLSIGTKQKINDWGWQNWRAVLKGLNGLNLRLVLIGGPEDAERSQMLADEWEGPALNLCGKISPRVSAAVIQNFVLLLCHDSGPMHLAASVGTRCVAVFSRRNPPGQWFPFGKNHKIFYPLLTTDTVQSIEPDQIIAAATEILGGIGKPSKPDYNVAASPARRPQAVKHQG